jgi:hypothetical protein
VIVPTASREYIAGWPADDWRTTADRLVDTLRSWNAPHRRVNWEVRWLTTEAEATDEAVPAAEVVARGGFPAAFVNLTFDPDRVGAAELAALEQCFGLRQFKAARSRVGYFAAPGAAPDRCGS